MVDLRRCGRILVVQLRTSALGALQYRVDFVLDLALELLWAATAIVPLFFVFAHRPSVAGWSFAGAILVMGFFTLVEAMTEIAVLPGLSTMSDHIEKGTLDFILTKPADAQLLVSTTRLQLPQAVNLLTGVGLIAFAMSRIGHAPAARDAAAASLALLCAVALVYALGVVVASTSFYVVRADNLNFLFKSVLSAARWPVTIFKGSLRFVFTFVIPLGLITTVPAQALLGEVSGKMLFVCALTATASLVVSRLVWTRALRRYTSTS